MQLIIFVQTFELVHEENCVIVLGVGDSDRYDVMSIQKQHLNERFLVW